jgi:hypothetical protein
MRPSLEQLKKLAKELLLAFRRGEPDAQTRLRRWFPDLVDARLSQAQLALAREHGFPSWTRLVAWLSRGEMPTTPEAQVELLGVRDWRVIGAAKRALADAGPDGVAAALAALSSSSPRIRRGAADFLDHFADDRCVEKLAELALGDPVPYVRRVAVHALLCQRCKPAPLTVDVLPLLLRIAREDPTPRVREEAIWGLAQQGPDPRSVAVLAGILRDDAHDDVRRVAHKALRHLSPDYRAEAARRAREAAQM